MTHEEAIPWASRFLETLAKNGDFSSSRERLLEVADALSSPPVRPGSAREIDFYVSFPGDSSAGMLPYTERVGVVVESGAIHEGLDSYLLQCFREWCDGARVEVEGFVKGYRSKNK